MEDIIVIVTKHSVFLFNIANHMSDCRKKHLKNMILLLLFGLQKLYWWTSLVSYVSRTAWKLCQINAFAKWMIKRSWKLIRYFQIKSTVKGTGIHRVAKAKPKVSYRDAGAKCCVCSKLIVNLVNPIKVIFLFS